MSNSAQLRRTSIIALIAMLMLAIVPTISKVNAAEQTMPHMVELCTAQGTKWFSDSGLGGAAATGHDEAPTSLHQHGDDCPYCSLSAAKFLMSAPQSTSATKALAPLPSLFYQAPKPPFAWAHSRSRAPPSAT